MERAININKQQHAMNILEKLNSFRKKKKYCDFVIKAGSREIAVHRYVVAGASDYFDAMLSHETLESETGVATLKDVHPDSVEKCIQYIYTGELSITEENYQPMMHLAHMWQLQNLCDGIAENLGSNLNLSTFFYTNNLAKLYNCKNLVTLCNDFALEHFSEISKLDEFGCLEKDDVEFLVSKYSQEDHTVRLQAVLKWVKHDASNRKECLIGFMGNLDLTKIPLEHRRFVMENEPLINESNKVLKMWMQSLFQSFNVDSNDLSEEPTSILIFDNNSNRFQSLNMTEKSWRPILEMDPNVTAGEFFIAVSGQHLFVFSSNKKKNFRISCSEPNQWERLAHRNIAGEVRTLSLNGIIYISECRRISKRMEAYDIARNTWNMIPGKRIGGQNEALATSDGSIFTVGGWDGNIEISHVERFDPATSSWTDDGNLNIARNRASAATTGKMIFVLGGFNNGPLSDVEFRCPEKRSWTRVTSMQVSRYIFNAVCINQKIYAIGGDRSQNSLPLPPTIEEYDPETKQWKQFLSINDMNISYLASVALAV